MSRLIFVPQFPTRMRYQEWFFTEFPKEFRKHFDEVIVLGEKYITLFNTSSSSEMFSPIVEAINFENCQILEFLDLKLYDDDIILLMDLSFPGFFANVLYHKPVKNAFAYCHATSKNAYDYFAPVRKNKWLTEVSHSKLFKKVFVATYYHQSKLWKKIRNTRVIGLPKPPFETFKEKKKYEIICVSRPCRQKVSKKLERIVERELGTKVVREECSTWQEYYKFLSQGEVLLITTNEDTFGYQALEAAMNNTYVVAPNKFSYPELLEKFFLYNDELEALAKIRLRIDYPDTVPRLLNQNLIDFFYDNIVKLMKEESK